MFILIPQRFKSLMQDSDAIMMIDAVFIKSDDLDLVRFPKLTRKCRPIMNEDILCTTGKRQIPSQSPAPMTKSKSEEIEPKAQPKPQSTIKKSLSSGVVKTRTPATRESFFSSKVTPKETKTTTPKPTKSVIWSNLNNKKEFKPAPAPAIALSKEVTKQASQIKDLFDGEDDEDDEESESKRSNDSMGLNDLIRYRTPTNDL